LLAEVSVIQNITIALHDIATTALEPGNGKNAPKCEITIKKNSELSPQTHCGGEAIIPIYYQYIFP